MVTKKEIVLAAVDDLIGRIKNDSLEPSNSTYKIMLPGLNCGIIEFAVETEVVESITFSQSCKSALIENILSLVGDDIEI